MRDLLRASSLLEQLVAVTAEAPALSRLALASAEVSRLEAELEVVVGRVRVAADEEGEEARGL